MNNLDMRVLSCYCQSCKAGQNDRCLNIQYVSKFERKILQRSGERENVVDVSNLDVDNVALQ